jgi:hypothetical protein
MTTYDLSDVENDLIDYADFEETDSVSRANCLSQRPSGG